MNTEPARIIALINAAIVATLAILLVVGMDPDLVAAISAAAVAWIAVAGEIVRARVTPVAQLSKPRDTGQAFVTLMAAVVLGGLVLFLILRALGAI